MTFITVFSTVISIFLWISVAAALFTIITFSLFTELRTFSFKLVMYLCSTIVAGFSAFYFSSSNAVYESWACWPMAILVHYFFLANFGWCFAMACNFFQMIVRKNRDAEKLESLYHLIAWGIPAIMVSIVGSMKHYGRVEGVSQCYLDENITIFWAFFLPGLAVVATNGLFFFFITREIHLASSSEDKKNVFQQFKVNIWIFLSIGMTWLFGFCIYLIPIQGIELAFYVLFALCISLQGVIIFWIYCVNIKVFVRWMGILAYCPLCGEQFAKIEESMISSSSYYSQL